MATNPKINQRTTKQVATLSISVKASDSKAITNACHKILSFIKKVDRHGVVNLNLTGVEKPDENVDSSLLD